MIIGSQKFTLRLVGQGRIGLLEKIDHPRIASGDRTYFFQLALFFSRSSGESWVTAEADPSGFRTDGDGNRRSGGSAGS